MARGLKNTGKPAEQEFKARIEAKPRSKVWRLPDSADINGRNRGKLGSSRVGAPKQPSDTIVATDGRLAFVEIKSSSNLDRFPYSNIEASQNAGAHMAAACGVEYYFVIRNETLRKWYILSAEEYVSDVSQGRKSRKWEELAKCHLFSTT